MSLTDFISGKYSLSYERVVDDWTTAELTVTGIGMTTTDYTYTIAQPLLYPWDSFYPNLPADLDMEISGWEVQAAVRKYGWVDDGVPDGFYASAFLTAGAATVHADERIRDVAFDPDTVTFEPGAFLDEIDHTLNVTKWGFGLTIGYQWLTIPGGSARIVRQRTQQRSTGRAYMGPMFRGITRTYLMERYSPEEARDIVRQRFVEGILTSDAAATGWAPDRQKIHYNGNTGPWFSGQGLRVSLAF